MFGRIFVWLWIMKREADPGGCQFGGLRPLDCWYRGFLPRWGHGCSFLVFVVCCVGSCLCDEPINRSEESYRLCVCVYLIMCDLGTLTTRRSSCELGCCATEEMKAVRTKYCPEYWIFNQRWTNFPKVKETPQKYVRHMMWHEASFLLSSHEY